MKTKNNILNELITALDEFFAFADEIKTKTETNEKEDIPTIN